LKAEVLVTNVCFPKQLPIWLQISASFIFTLHLAEKGQRHPAADLRGYKPLQQFTIFSSNKSVNYFYFKMKNAKFRIRSAKDDPLPVNTHSKYRPGIKNETLNTESLFVTNPVIISKIIAKDKCDSDSY